MQYSSYTFKLINVKFNSQSKLLHRKKKANSIRSRGNKQNVQASQRTDISRNSSVWRGCVEPWNSFISRNRRSMLSSPSCHTDRMERKKESAHNEFFSPFQQQELLLLLLSSDKKFYSAVRLVSLCVYFTTVSTEPNKLAQVLCVLIIFKFNRSIWHLNLFHDLSLSVWYRRVW